VLITEGKLFSNLGKIKNGQMVVFPVKYDLSLKEMIMKINKREHLVTLHEMMPPDPSNPHFQTIFDTSAVGIGIMSLDRKLIDANPALCQMFGLPRHELIGKTPVIVTYPEDYPASTRQFEELLSGKTPTYWGERRYVRANGDIFWAQITMSVVRDEDGKPLYLVGMLEDIDRQKKAIAGLQESEARFRTIFENSPIGIALVGLDGFPLAVNPAILSMTGYTEEELLSISGLDLTHPDYRPLAAELMQQLIDGNQDVIQVDSCFIRKNGQSYWVRQKISTVRGLDGKLAYIVVMVEDIDEQKRVQAELSESEQHFRSVFENSAIGISLIGPNRIPIAVNKALIGMTGYSADELMQKTGREFSFPEDVEIGDKEFWDVVEGRRNTYQVEKRYVKKDRNVYWARLTVAGVYDPQGKLLYMVAMTEDITVQKETASKLALQEAEYLQSLELRVEERTRELSEANLRLVNEIEQRQRAEEELAHKAAEEAILAERTRLARDLHDAVTQTLFSASLIAEVLPELWEMNPEEARKSNEELRQLTRGALAEMRTLLLELRPSALTQARFPDLIKQLSEAVIGRARLPVKLSVEGEYELPPDVKVAFYRIAQESLNNIVKYSRARHVVINIDLDCCDVHFEIRDDGRGFDQSQIKPTSLGMRIMHERAEAVHAHLDITSVPGKGTMVKVDWNEDQAIPNSPVPNMR
jgi:PAS domain S-box-containing protein